MNHTLTIAAALLLGLVASGHCLAMCGGLTAALGLATANTVGRSARACLLVGYQLGRITSYSLAGLLLAGALGSVIALLDIESVRLTLRTLSAAALLVAAFVVFGRVRGPGFGIGARLWRRIAPVGRRLLPVASFPRAFAFGMVWGWMPCGFVYSVLLIATLQQGALQGAATMAAFGLGTSPAMLLASVASRQLVSRASGAIGRKIAGTMLLLSAAATLAVPWLGHDFMHSHG